MEQLSGNNTDHVIRQQRQEQQDDPEQLPKVGLEDIPAELSIPEGESSTIGAMPASWYARGTNGLVYQQVVVDLPELDEELAQLLPLFTDILTEVGSGNRDYLESQALQAAVTGGIGASVSLRGAVDDLQQSRGSFTLSGKALVRNQAALADLMQETFESARFDELPRIRELVAQERMYHEQHVTSAGHSLAMTAATEIIGASRCETLDTKGTDGSNIHLGGPETIAGYFGGVGQPNDHAFAWVEEFLLYYTSYGIKQVLNINHGTVLLGYLLHKLGVDIEFKISVFMGNDNPLSILSTLLTANLFRRNDDTTPLVGFNLSNSANNETIRLGNRVREALDMTDQVRFEHHITETYKSIVIQPYNRRDELVVLALDVPNLAAKHEGGDPDIEKELERPSDILDYFLPKKTVYRQGLMTKMKNHYILKHIALNSTADALTENGIGVKAAPNLHK